MSNSLGECLSTTASTSASTTPSLAIKRIVNIDVSTPNEEVKDEMIPEATVVVTGEEADEDDINRFGVDTDFDAATPILRSKTSTELLSEIALVVSEDQAKIASFILQLKEGDIVTKNASAFRARRLTYAQRTAQAPEEPSPVKLRAKRTSIFASSEVGMRQEKQAPFSANFMGTFSNHGTASTLSELYIQRDSIQI